MKNRYYGKRHYPLQLILALSCMVILLTCNSCLSPKTDDKAKFLNVKEDNKKNYVEAQLGVLKNITSGAKVISKANTENKQVALVFEGMGSSETMDGILQLLKKYNIKATFFLPGIRVAEEPNIARSIVKAGQRIGNNTLNKGTNLQNATEEELIKEFYHTNMIIKEKTGVKPNLFRCTGAKYTQKLCRVAKACGLDYAIDTNISLTNERFSSTKEADAFAKVTKRGSIICIATEGKYDVLTTVQTILNAYTKEGFSFMDMDSVFTSQKVYAQDLVAIKNKQGIHTGIFSFANTSSGYVTLTFDGIGSKEHTMNILNALDKNKIKATFFLTGYEVLDHLDLVKKIVSRGHDIQNQGLSDTDLTKLGYDQAQLEIFRGGKILKEKLGVKAKFVKSVFGSTNDTVCKAANDLGYVLTTYSKRPQGSNKESASQIMEYLKKGVKRGDVISLRGDTNMEVIHAIPQIAKMVNSIGYSFVTLDKLYNSQYSNTSLKNIKGWNDVCINKNFDSTADVSGHSIQSIPTKEKVVFLTFDDWGSDKTITHILNILSRYNIKASFFLIGSGVERNPNLVKAIADSGHDIGNHTYSHKVITELNMNELQSEVVKCYQSLTYAIKRKPNLIFRSPRLEMNNAVANGILACGYKYIVSGNIVPRDFDVNVSDNDIVKEVMTNTVPGDIISLHLTDHASAIRVLPKIIEGLRAKGYKFSKLSDYLK